MKTKILIFSTPFIVAFLVQVFNFIQLGTGPHGGKIKQAQIYKIEAKSMYPFIYMYLLDNKNDPVKNKNLSCDITFLLTDSTDYVVNAKPYRDDGFLIESGALYYNSFRVTFNVSGKLVSATFQNENVVVKKIKQNKTN